MKFSIFYGLLQHKRISTCVKAKTSYIRCEEIFWLYCACMSCIYYVYITAVGSGVWVLLLQVSNECLNV